MCTKKIQPRIGNLHFKAEYKCPHCGFKYSDDWYAKEIGKHLDEQHCMPVECVNCTTAFAVEYAALENVLALTGRR